MEQIGTLVDKSNVYVRETTDKSLIESVFYNADIKKYLFENEAHEINWKLAENVGAKFYALYQDELCGMVVFMPVFDTIWMVDIGIFSEKRGPMAYEAAKIAVDMFFMKNYGDFIIAKIKKKNRKNLFFAVNCGFKHLFNTKIYNYLGVKNGWGS